MSAGKASGQLWSERRRPFRRILKQSLLLAVLTSLNQHTKMELDKFDRQLRLMLLLVQNRRLSVDEISERLGLNRRSIYRYLESFRKLGFIVRKEGSRYSIDHESPFFQNISDRIHFSTDEAITINQVLNSVLDNSPQVRHLRQKLSSLYDVGVLSTYGVDDHLAHNISTLHQAIETECMVVLKNYISPHSGDVRDRIVEPYLFCAENTEVRCYEVSTGINKTFKIARAESVEILDLLWSHKDKHAPFHRDLFHFTGEQLFPVKLKLGALATSLLLEEHPGAETSLTLLDDGRHLFSTEVCSYKGIGRFVIGLFDDIEITDSPDFEAYIRNRIKDLTQKFNL